MISVASEMTQQTLGSFEGGAQLPVQVVHDMRIMLTYHAEGLNILNAYLMFNLSGLNSSGIKPDFTRSDNDSACSCFLYFPTFCGVIEYFTDITNESLHWFF